MDTTHFSSDDDDDCNQSPQIYTSAQLSSAQHSSASELVAAIYEAKAQAMQQGKGVSIDAETFDILLRRWQLVVIVIVDAATATVSASASAADDVKSVSSYISCNLILALKCIH